MSRGARYGQGYRIHRYLWKSCYLHHDCPGDEGQGKSNRYPFISRRCVEKKERQTLGCETTEETAWARSATRLSTLKHFLRRRIRNGDPSSRSSGHNVGTPSKESINGVGESNAFSPDDGAAGELSLYGPCAFLISSSAARRYDHRADRPFARSAATVCLDIIPQLYACSRIVHHTPV